MCEVGSSGAPTGIIYSYYIPSQDRNAAKHLYQMPETTFGLLVERLLKIMDVHPHGQDIFLCVLAGKAFQQVGGAPTHGKVAATHTSRNVRQFRVNCRQL